MRDPDCTCWYGNYVTPTGATGFDIARYDPACPVHGEPEEDETPVTEGPTGVAGFLSGRYR